MASLTVHRLASVTSTQDEARRLALAGAPAGTVVRADEQTAGRGRAGRAWASPAGGLWFSVVLRPSSPAARWSVLPLAAGAAAAVGLLEVGVAARIKWPNDLRVAGRKVGGVLVESRPPEFAVVGVGINAGFADETLPPELREAAHGLGLAAPRVDALFSRIAQGIVDRADALDAHGAGSILAEWRPLAETLGARIERAGVRGVAVDVADDGALVVEADDGRRVRLTEAE